MECITSWRLREYFTVCSFNNDSKVITQVRLFPCGCPLGFQTEWLELGVCLTLSDGQKSHYLPRSSVAGHPRLRRSSVGAHLQANDALTLLQLLLWEISLVLLRFPKKDTHIHTHTCSKQAKSSRYICSAVQRFKWRPRCKTCTSDLMQFTD